MIIKNSLKNTIGYMPKSFVLATLPHRDPKTSEFSRKNGDYILTMQSPSHIGLPYGTFPRLILIWLTTEVILKKSQEITLGKSLNHFMKNLKIPRTGVYIRQLKEQITRLFGTQVILYQKTNETRIGNGFKPLEEINLLWNSNESKPDHSNVLLSKGFFEYILKNSIPISIEAIQKIRQSPLAIDIYCWLTHRLSYLKKDVLIPWKSLQEQFGADYANTKQGRYKFKLEFDNQMLKILQIYPDAFVTKEKTGIIIRPSSTHIKMKGEACG